MALTKLQTILVVDDDRAVRTLAKAYLERAGYMVLTAGDGEEGLDIIRRRQDGIALLITDVVMPKLDGLQLVDAALRIRPHLPVLFISGNAQNADRGHGCLAKPFTSSQLVCKIDQVVAARKMERTSSTESGRVAQPAEPLTQREKEVLPLICEGFSSKAIAQKLGISFKTVVSHGTHILEKRSACMRRLASSALPSAPATLRLKRRLAGATEFRSDGDFPRFVGAAMLLPAALTLLIKQPNIQRGKTRLRKKRYPGPKKMR